MAADYVASEMVLRPMGPGPFDIADDVAVEHRELGDVPDIDMHDVTIEGSAISVMRFSRELLPFWRDK